MFNYVAVIMETGPEVVQLFLSRRSYVCDGEPVRRSGSDSLRHLESRFLFSYLLSFFFFTFSYALKS